jgi:hypothetical protein
MSTFPTKRLTVYPPTVRATQRDTYHVALLKEQTESVLRSWQGTRWLARWTPEVDFIVKLLYYSLLTGRGMPQSCSTRDSKDAKIQL